MQQLTTLVKKTTQLQEKNRLWLEAYCTTLNMKALIAHPILQYICVFPTEKYMRGTYVHVQYLSGRDKVLFEQQSPWHFPC